MLPDSFLPTILSLSTDPLPEPSQSPHPANATALLPLLDALAPLADLARPDAADPPPETILQPLALDGALLGDEARRDRALDALARQDAALDQDLGRGAQGQAAGEPDGDEVAGEPARDLRRVGQEDAPRDQVPQRWAGGGDQERWEGEPGAAETVAVEYGLEGEGSEVMICLGFELATPHHSRSWVSREVWLF